tara:strand:- start:1887 stop:2456 length:570 start_codon:yes stop_codon:yes gene_type:complete
MEKHKAIAIPVSLTDDNVPLFLTVKDRRFNEWIFVTGGCRKMEVNNPLRCALRELEEETRGVINIKKGLYNYFNFSISSDKVEVCPRFPPIEYIYHVYIIYVNIHSQDRLNFIEKFYDEKEKSNTRKRNGLPVKRVYDENEDMVFETLSDFKSRARVWELIRDNILNNPAFNSALTSPPRHSFNITYSK